MEISENGKGVLQELIDNIAEISKSAHGLGLTMVYRIIKARGGGLGMELRRGENTNEIAVGITV